MNLKNKKVTFNGKTYYILTGKPTSIPNRSIYLLNTSSEGQDYSLWYAEIIDDGENTKLWPYEGTDTKEITMQLVEEFIETAFEFL